MKTSEFDYQLPPELIATHPIEPRDAARLLILDKHTGECQDSKFLELLELLGPRDVLVLNDTKVIPARLFGKVDQREFEILLIKMLADGSWEAWIKPGKKIVKGDIIRFKNGLEACVLRRYESIFFIRFNQEKLNKLFVQLAEIGEMPVPPYILKARHEKHQENADDKDYQTVFARKAGSVAAPTASLHFTEELLEHLSKRGVQIEFVTLHVGLGTFEPVKTTEIEDFRIHSEYFEIKPDVADRLNRAKSNGKRIIAAGTTAVRVLESSATDINSCGLLNKGGCTHLLLPKSGETNIFIHPGYKFKFVDGMITNFHQPQSSLIMLVSAFAGTKNIKNAYLHAIKQEYRFFSYGDAMVIL